MGAAISKMSYGWGLMRDVIPCIVSYDFCDAFFVIRGSCARKEDLFILSSQSRQRQAIMSSNMSSEHKVPQRPQNSELCSKPTLGLYLLPSLIRHFEKKNRFELISSLLKRKGNEIRKITS